jgi:cell wall integrity and stress response component
LTGFTHNQIGYFSPSSSSSSSVTSSTATSSSTSTAAATSKKSSPVGIVVGVIVAVVVVGALAGFAFFYFRRRQNAEMDEFKKNSDISSFVGSGSTAIDSNRPQMWAPDQRLDTNTAGNRISNGSIADNQDYSRKILQV